MNCRRFSILSFFCLVLACTAREDAPPTREDLYPIPRSALKIETSGSFGGVLRIPLLGEPVTFNPVSAQDTRSRTIAYLTSATLLEFDPYSQRVVDGIAAKRGMSDDGARLRLELRSGVNFSDGTPVTLDDILFTFEAIYRQESANPLKAALTIEKQPLKVHAVGDFDFEVAFPGPYAAAEYILTKIPVLPKHRFQDSGKRIEDYWNLDTPPEEMAGLGPFVIRDHSSGQRTRLEFNPHYWKIDREDRRLPYLDGLLIEYLQDPNSHLLRIQSGELDLIDQVIRPEDFEVLRRAPGVKVENLGPSGHLMILWFNLNSGLDEDKASWFHNPDFRRAISMAISRESIVRNVYQGAATQTWTLTPESIQRWHRADLAPGTQGLEAARAALREAGFSWTQDRSGTVLRDRLGRPVQFQLLTTTHEILSRTAAVIQQDVEQLGISVQIQSEEMRSVISRVMGSRQYDAALMNLDFPYDPADWGSVLLSSGSMHFWRPLQDEPATPWEARIDELMHLQNRTMDPERRREIVFEIQGILAEQAPLLPLVNRNSLVAYREGWGNIRPAGMFPYALWNAWEIYQTK